VNEPSAAPEGPSAPAEAPPTVAIEQPVEAPPEPPPAAPDEPVPSTARRFFWQGKLKPAFWTVACVISLAVNIVLFVVLILLGSQIFAIKAVVEDQLIGGLYDNFVQMDQAHIITTILVSDTIQVKDSMPVVFTLPLEQETQVVLTRDAEIRRATVFLNGAPVPTDIILKKGTKLDIYLDMDVPVDQVVPVELTVPVQLTVPVDIPLDQTELHQPFVGLQEVLLPYKELLAQLPDSWDELLCSQFPDSWCK
jgi:hypothetical protein